MGRPNVCLSWAETVEWASLLELALPPVLYRGPWDERRLRALPGELDPERQEGFVVRTSAAFPFESFGDNVAKWVRPHHVTTDEHWMSRPVVAHRLRP